MAVSRRTTIVALVIAVIVLALGGGAVVMRLRSSPSSPAPQLIFAEFTSRSDSIFTAPADDPAKRTLVATAEHAEGWGLNPAVAPAGSRVAYTVLAPASRPQADSPAELWLLDVRTKAKQRVAGDADLRVQPVFDRDGKYLVYRSSTSGGLQSLIRVELTTATRRPLVAVETSFGIFPIGFDREGAVLYARVSTQGTDIHRVIDGQPPTFMLHASDQVTRDWRLSPDGSALAYLAPEIAAERVVNRLNVVRIDGAVATRVNAISPTVDQFGTAWNPRGDAVTVGRETGTERRMGAVIVPLSGGDVIPLPAPAQGFDRPLLWSADGSVLAAHSFDGLNANSPGVESTVVIKTDGTRRTVTGTGDIIVFGWVTHA